MDLDRTALLVVDVQNDFCPGGALAVPDGDAVVPVLSRVAQELHVHGATVYASRDWHPRDTTHFKEHGGVWPVHCVAHSSGAAFHATLALPSATRVVSKGTDPGADGYSAFEGRTPGGPTFADDLRQQGVTHVVVGGLATDYCVKASVLDARKRGFEVTVLTDAIRGVEVHVGDSARALEDMRKAGAKLTTSDELLDRLRSTAAGA